MKMVILTKLNFIQAFQYHSVLIIIVLPIFEEYLQRIEFLNEYIMLIYEFLFFVIIANFLIPIFKLEAKCLVYAN